MRQASPPTAAHSSWPFEPGLGGITTGGSSVLRTVRTPPVPRLALFVPHPKGKTMWKVRLTLAGMLALSSATFAQPEVGQYIACVRSTGSTPTGRIVYVDLAKRAVTPVTISDPKLATDEPNCIRMLTPTLGFIGSTGVAGTNVTPVPADLYRAVFSGTKVTVTKLNSSPHKGYNLAQVVIAGGKLYYTTADANSTCGTGCTGYWNGFLYELALSGGTPTVLADFSAVTGFPANSTPNALATDGQNKVWIYIWPGGGMYEYDIAKKTTTQVGTLPPTKLNNTTTFYPLHAQNVSQNVVAVAGLYGDVAELDMSKSPPQVVNHWFDVKPTGTGLSTAINSLTINTNTGDYVKGTRDGAVDVTVREGGGHSATRFVRGLGTSATASQNSVAAIYYRPGGAGKFETYGPGGAGTGNFIPTSVAAGDPSTSSTNFGIGVGGVIGGNPAILMIGAGRLNVDLTAAGAPGHFLYTAPLVFLPTGTANTGNGQGVAMLAFPLPNNSLTIDFQWTALDAAANALKLTFSDGRELKN